MTTCNHKILLIEENEDERKKLQTEIDCDNKNQKNNQSSTDYTPRLLDDRSWDL